MFKTFFQGHISQISNLRMSPFFRVHDSASYRRVLQTTGLHNSLSQAKVEGVFISSFLLVNAFFARTILD